MMVITQELYDLANDNGSEEAERLVQLEDDDADPTEICDAAMAFLAILLAAGDITEEDHDRLSDFDIEPEDDADLLPEEVED
jgi:hypothetical protein